MEQNKKPIVIAVVVTAVVVMLLGGGGVLAYSRLHHKSVLDDGGVSYSATNGGSTTSLNQPDQTNGLGVTSSGGAQSLGQLGNAATSNAAQGTQGNNPGTGGSSSNAPTVDPSTFAQYDQYKDKTQALFGEVQAGDGAAVTATSKVSVYYKGWLTNGQLFDQSRTGSDGKLQPFTFQMGAHQVIPGWEQGLAGMKVGGTRLVIVPPAVGYGNQAQGSIPADSLLVFEVQLLDAQ